MGSSDTKIVAKIEKLIGKKGEYGVKSINERCKNSKSYGVMKTIDQLQE